MENITTLLIGTKPFTDIIEAFLDQQHKFKNLTADNFDAGLDIASQELPNLIFLESNFLNQLNFSKMSDFKTLSSQPFLIVYNLVRKDVTYLRDLINAGVDDYLLNPFTFKELEDLIEAIYPQDGSSRLMPIVHKLLEIVKYQEDEIAHIYSALQWYRYSLGLIACDCEYIIKQYDMRPNVQAPTSSALKRIERRIEVEDYAKYVCEVCHTIWLKWRPMERRDLIMWKPQIKDDGQA